MLQSLFIQNYALIDTLDIQFQPGFSVITGETGAGKSIILGAIGLLLGQRADSKAIKNGTAKCVIEARFDLGPYGMEDFFRRNDLEFDGQECIIRREVMPSGKSRAFDLIDKEDINQIQRQGIYGRIKRRRVEYHYKPSLSCLADRIGNIIDLILKHDCIPLGESPDD